MDGHKSAGGQGLSKNILSPSLERKILLGIAVPSGILLFLLFAAIYSEVRFLRSELRMENLEKEQLLVNRTLSDLKDAETGERGFLITGIPSYLEPYRVARKDLVDDLGGVSRLSGLVPGLAGELPHFDDLIREKLGELQVTLSLRENAGFSAAKEMVMNGFGKNTMDLIRKLSVRMGDQCQVAIGVARKTVLRRERRLIGFGMLTAFSIIVLLSFLFNMIYRDIQEKKYLLDRLEDESTHDFLTRLHNRAFFTDCFRKALSLASRGNSRPAILMIDLDGFKQVNDRFGHQMGDAVLVEVSRLFARVTRESDILARLGGDEFVILVPVLEKAADLSVLAERILSVFSKPVLPDLGEVSLGASIGIAVFPDDGADPDALLNAADRALYLAKKEGRNCYRFHGDTTTTPS